MSLPTYFPLRWESTGDQWWFASPIDFAAANGHYELARELLRLDGNHLIKLTSLRRIRRLETVWDDEEQFHDVAKSRSEVARKLHSDCEIKRGKNSLIGNGYGGWLLYTAASAGDLGFVKELLEKDPLLVFGEGEYGVTDILYAAARSRNDEVFKVVFDFAAAPRFSGGGGGGAGGGMVPSGYKMEILNRGIHAAARGGNLKLLKELLGDCTDGALAYRDVHGATILHAAAGRGRVQVVKELASAPELIKSTDNQGNTALHVAANRGHLEVVEALILAAPSLVTATNNAGETFLHSIITGFQTPGFQRLDRQIALLKYILHGDLFKVEEIINAKTNDGKTALHLAISGNIHSNLVELLMSFTCIDVNIRDTNGSTPLDVLKQRPRTMSTEILSTQLISAGGILSSQDYSARKAIASHIKRQSIGNSPGTSFRINDIEIFLHTGLENADEGNRISTFSPEESHHDSNTETHSPKKTINTKERIKRFLHWPSTKNRSFEGFKKPVEVSIPLRQRYSKTSNKRALSVRSNVPSPSAKKKLASGLKHGVMQAIPSYAGPGSHRSRSSSFSKLSVSSSPSSVETVKGGITENGVVKGSCSTNHMNDEHGLVNRKLMNNFLCFGARGETGEASSSGMKAYDVYELSVLSAA